MGKYISARGSYYADYLLSSHWKQVQKVVYAKAKICARCKADKKLNIHHISYKNLWKERWSDIIVLCSDCHTALHNSVKMGTKQSEWLDQHCHGTSRGKKRIQPKIIKGSAHPKDKKMHQMYQKTKPISSFNLNQEMDLEEWRSKHPHAL